MHSTMLGIMGDAKEMGDAAPALQDSIVLQSGLWIHIDPV